VVVVVELVDIQQVQQEQVALVEEIMEQLVHLAGVEVTEVRVVTLVPILAQVVVLAQKLTHPFFLPMVLVVLASLLFVTQFKEILNGTFCKSIRWISSQSYRGRARVL
jgi:hypothetical protein